jgi:hypothetical protein
VICTAAQPPAAAYTRHVCRAFFTCTYANTVLSGCVKCAAGWVQRREELRQRLQLDKVLAPELEAQAAERDALAAQRQVRQLHVEFRGCHRLGSRVCVRCGQASEQGSLHRAAACQIAARSDRGRCAVEPVLGVFLGSGAGCRARQAGGPAACETAMWWHISGVVVHRAPSLAGGLCLSCRARQPCSTEAVRVYSALVSRWTQVSWSGWRPSPVSAGTCVSCANV